MTLSRLRPPNPGDADGSVGWKELRGNPTGYHRDSRTATISALVLLYWKDQSSEPSVIFEKHFIIALLIPPAGIQIMVAKQHDVQCWRHSECWGPLVLPSMRPPYARWISENQGYNWINPAPIATGLVAVWPSTFFFSCYRHAHASSTWSSSQTRSIWQCRQDRHSSRGWVWGCVRADRGDPQPPFACSGCVGWPREPPCHRTAIGTVINLRTSWDVSVWEHRVFKTHPGISSWNLYTGRWFCGVHFKS